MGPSDVLSSVVNNTCAEGVRPGERPAILVPLFSGQLTGAPPFGQSDRSGAGKRVPDSRALA